MKFFAQYIFLFFWCNCLYSQLSIDSLEVGPYQVENLDSSNEVLIGFSVSDADSISLFYINIEDEDGEKTFKLLESESNRSSIYVAKCEGYDKVLLKIYLPEMSSRLSRVRIYVSDTERLYSNALIYDGME